MEGSLGQQGFGQSQYCNVRVLRIQRPTDCFTAGYPEIQPADVPRFFCFGKIKPGIVHAQRLFGVSRIPVAEGIWPEVKPKLAEGIRAVVDVFQIQRSPQDMCRIVERGGNPIICFLLKIELLRPAGQRKRQEQRGKQEPEHRRDNFYWNEDRTIQAAFKAGKPKRLINPDLPTILFFRPTANHRKQPGSHELTFTAKHAFYHSY